jgi:transcriptional regulator with XRE-family HTH domain
MNIEELRKISKDLDKNDGEFAKFLGIAGATLSSIYSGKTENPGIQIIENILENSNILTPERLWKLFTKRPIPKKKEAENVDILIEEKMKLEKQVEKLEHEKDRLYTIIERLSQPSIIHQEGTHTNDRDNQGEKS